MATPEIAFFWVCNAAWTVSGVPPAIGEPMLSAAVTWPRRLFFWDAIWAFRVAAACCAAAVCSAVARPAVSPIRPCSLTLAWDEVIPCRASWKRQVLLGFLPLPVDLLLGLSDISPSVILEILRAEFRESVLDLLRAFTDNPGSADIVLALPGGLFLDLLLLLVDLFLLSLELLFVYYVLPVRDIFLGDNLPVRQFLRRHLLVLRDSR